MLVLLCGLPDQEAEHSLSSTSFRSQLLFLLELLTLHNLIYCKDLSNLLVKGNVLSSKLPNGYSGDPKHSSGGPRTSDSYPRTLGCCATLAPLSTAPLPKGLESTDRAVGDCPLSVLSSLSSHGSSTMFLSAGFLSNGRPSIMQHLLVAGSQGLMHREEMEMAGGWIVGTGLVPCLVSTETGMPGSLSLMKGPISLSMPSRARRRFLVHTFP